MLTQVETLAITDSPTGLFNRRRFEAILSTEFKRAHRYGHPLSCLMIDVDHFKLVNGTYGHHVGDAVLKEIAQLIQQSVREVDTAVRRGGEEFTVLIPNTTKDDSLQAAARIMKAVTHHAFSAGAGIKVTLSIARWVSRALSFPRATAERFDPCQSHRRNRYYFVRVFFDVLAANRASSAGLFISYRLRSYDTLETATRTGQFDDSERPKHRMMDNER